MTMLRAGRRLAPAVASLTAGLALAACAGSLTDVAPPSNLVDPDQVKTQAAAVGLYSGAMGAFSSAFGGTIGSARSYAAISGVFGDEYTTTSVVAGYDTHTITALAQNGAGPYEWLHNARIAADEAIGALTAHGGTAPKSYLGELHAIKGYVYVLLSELYCSGIPFSTLVPNGNLAYGTAESRDDMLQHALTQFDSAATFSADSVRIQQLIALGRGRAYLDLGDFANAKSAVAVVPTAYSYAATYNTQAFQNYFGSMTTASFPVFVDFFMTSREGTNGLDYTTAGDTRVASTPLGGYPIPSKFAAANAPVVLASGTEARLIEAEAALRAHDVPGWAAALNDLRTGAGMTAIGSDSTTGAATDSVRVDVTFRERAFWLFGTGHRAGDMRRLIRQYGRLPGNVFPIGIQPYSFTSMVYVPSAVLEPPKNETDNNPSYHGCINKDA